MSSGDGGHGKVHGESWIWWQVSLHMTDSFFFFDVINYKEESIARSDHSPFPSSNVFIPLVSSIPKFPPLSLTHSPSFIFLFHSRDAEPPMHSSAHPLNPYSHHKFGNACGDCGCGCGARSLSHLVR